MRFLKVPNAVFSYGLAPNALKVYTYLLTCANALGTATVRVGTIQKNCGIASPATVRTALAELEQKQLVSASRRHGRGGLEISSRFSVKRLGGAWFRLWLDCAPFSLDKSAFAVYLYLCRQRVSYSGKACPSQSAIAHALGLARHTVNDAVQRLAQLGVALKGAFWRGKHSLYQVLMQRVTAPREQHTKKEMPLQSSAGTDAGHPTGLQPAFTIIQDLPVVNRLFCGRPCLFSHMGCANFNHQYIDVTCTPKKKKRNITGYIHTEAGKAVGKVCRLAGCIGKAVVERLRENAGRGWRFPSLRRKIE